MSFCLCFIRSRMMLLCIVVLYSCGIVCLLYVSPLLCNVDVMISTLQKRFNMRVYPWWDRRVPFGLGRISGVTLAYTMSASHPPSLFCFFEQVKDPEGSSSGRLQSLRRSKSFYGDWPSRRSLQPIFFIIGIWQRRTLVVFVEPLTHGSTLCFIAMLPEPSGRCNL